MKNHEQQTRQLVLVIAPLPHDLSAAEPGRLNDLRSSSFGTGPSWEDVDSADWYPCPWGDEEVAKFHRLVLVESVTEEQYRRFSEVVLPSSDGGWEGFSGQEMPPLDWIKRCFSNHIAAAEYLRHKKSDGRSREEPNPLQKPACEYNMKNHQTNIATNDNYPGPRKEKQACEPQLVILRLSEDFEKVANPEALQKLRSRSCTTKDLSWEHFAGAGASWRPAGDEEVANVMRIALVESMTEESYRRFSRIVLPLFGGLYGFFSREERPPLDWIKRIFINHIAVVQYWRYKKSDNEVSSVGNESCRTISQGLAQTIQGAVAEFAACKSLGISDEERRKLAPE